MIYFFPIVFVFLQFKYYVLLQGEFENQLVSHAPENIQTSIGSLNQVETEEVEPVCPLRTTQVEEPKVT